MTTWQSCDCYLLPVNGPFLCLISFTYGFAPLSFFSLFFYFPVYFSILAFSSFFAFFLFHSLLLFFLFIGKASLEPADYPRVLGYKKGKARCFAFLYIILVLVYKLKFNCCVFHQYMLLSDRKHVKAPPKDKYDMHR